MSIVDLFCDVDDFCQVFEPLEQERKQHLQQLPLLVDTVTATGSGVPTGYGAGGTYASCV